MSFENLSSNLQPLQRVASASDCIYNFNVHKEQVMPYRMATSESPSPKRWDLSLCHLLPTENGQIRGIEEQKFVSISEMIPYAWCHGPLLPCPHIFSEAFHQSIFNCCVTDIYNLPYFKVDVLHFGLCTRRRYILTFILLPDSSFRKLLSWIHISIIAWMTEFGPMTSRPLQSDYDMPPEPPR